MKDKLEPNMYVRTNDGYINKIKKVNQFNVLVYGRDLFGEELNIPNNEITKASHNIIDLIEFGDYVNGCYIQEIKSLKDNVMVCMLDSDYEFVSTITNKDIKSVITHEQMEQMAYKVGE